MISNVTQYTVDDVDDGGYAWAFGDGQTGSGAVVTHTYSAPGTYIAVVTASNPVSVMTATTQVTIAAPEPAVTKYYFHGERRVAMRQGDVVYYPHSDHLGSSSLPTITAHR